MKKQLGIILILAVMAVSLIAQVPSNIITIPDTIAPEITSIKTAIPENTNRLNIWITIYNEDGGDVNIELFETILGETNMIANCDTNGFNITYAARGNFFPAACHEYYAIVTDASGNAERSEIAEAYPIIYTKSHLGINNPNAVSEDPRRQYTIYLGATGWDDAEFSIKVNGQSAYGNFTNQNREKYIQLTDDFSAYAGQKVEVDVEFSHNEINIAYTDTIQILDWNDVDLDAPEIHCILTDANEGITFNVTVEDQQSNLDYVKVYAHYSGGDSTKLKYWDRNYSSQDRKSVAGSYTLSPEGLEYFSVSARDTYYRKVNNDGVLDLRNEIYRTVKNTLITSVPDILPEQFSISQNYPNPFNPATMISYTLPVDGNVQLDVFDVKGRWITTLIDGNQTAGRHQVRYDGSNMPSGVYFYRIAAGSFSERRKMILAK